MRLHELNEGLDANQKRVGQVGGEESAKPTGPVLGAKQKQHPFKGRLVGEESEQGVAEGEDSIGQQALRKDREAKAEWIKNNPLMKGKNPVEQQAAWAIYSTFHKTGTDKNKEKGVAEGNDKIADRYDQDEWDEKVQRLKKLAGMGPLKTVWDPEKRVYKNVPVNQNPEDK